MYFPGTANRSVAIVALPGGTLIVWTAFSGAFSNDPA